MSQTIIEILAAFKKLYMPNLDPLAPLLLEFCKNFNFICMNIQHKIVYYLEWEGPSDYHRCVYCLRNPPHAKFGSKFAWLVLELWRNLCIILVGAHLPLLMRKKCFHQSSICGSQLKWNVVEFLQLQLLRCNIVVSMRIGLLHGAGMLRCTSSLILRAIQVGTDFAVEFIAPLCGFAQNVTFEHMLVVFDCHIAYPSAVQSFA